MFRNALRVVPCLLTLAALALAPAARGQDTAHADVMDDAALFREESVRQARSRLVALEETKHVTVVVKTVEGLGGRTIDELAREQMRRLKLNGLLVLIAKKEHKIDVLAAPGLQAEVPRANQTAIRAAFLGQFEKRDFDKGLTEGVAAIEGQLGQPRSEAPSVSPAAPSDLVARNQVRLTLAGARAIVAGAEAKAREIGVKSNIAVTDDGGHLLAFERMDGARPASLYTALTKATTAATFRQDTGPIPKGAAAPDPLLNIGMQNAALASGGKLTTLLGGIPVTVDGQIIGAVGVGGGSGEQDAEVARAGVARFLAELTKPEPEAARPAASLDPAR